jgi:hypothetical protein
MQRLCCRHQVHRRVRKRNRLRARDRVLDVLVLNGAADLRLAWIGGDDATKVFCQSDRGLSVPGAAVDGSKVLARQSGELREEGVRV